MSVAHRAWRLLPPRLRREALFSAQAWLAPRPDRPAPDGRGTVAVAGFLSAPTGVGEAARLLLTVLRAAGLAPLAIDLTAPLRQGTAPPPATLPPGPGTLLVQVNAPMLPWALRVIGGGAIAGKRVIGVWNWELPVVPRDWDRGWPFVHGIWACSRFTAAALERPGTPVAVFPNAVPAPTPAPLDRAALGLPREAFVTLAVFDAGSSLARKNPLAAIAAHRLAFGDRADRLLVLKTHGTANAGPGWRAIAAAAGAAGNVRIIDAVWERPRVAALIAAADVFLSLHRSEGFGLGIAEAMRSGVPAVATGWSGNMDFMTPAATVAVPYDLVPARDPQRTYDLPGTVWAEARIEPAAAALRALADDPERRRAMGTAGRVAAATLDPVALVPLVRSLLEPAGAV